jgi:hypothetical protein
MIGLGILHAHFIAAIPPLGWSGAFWTNIGITFLLGGRSTGISVKKD